MQRKFSLLLKINVSVLSMHIAHAHSLITCKSVRMNVRAHVRVRVRVVNERKSCKSVCMNLRAYG